MGEFKNNYKLKLYDQIPKSLFFFKKKKIFPEKNIPKYKWIKIQLTVKVGEGWLKAVRGDRFLIN